MTKCSFYIFIYKKGEIENTSKMIIGSYNSMSYLQPANKWLKYINKWFIRYQEKTIEQQYAEGIRLFDIRLFVNKYGKLCFKCRFVEYIIFSLYGVFNFLNKQGDCYVRLTLEETLVDAGSNNIKNVEEKFIWACKLLPEIYPNIKFFGGKREFDGKLLYEFKNELKDYEYRLLTFI
jgi:hypothetical protein